MLLIGAAGRNVGKTELACTLIRQFNTAQSITGVKITVINERERLCPRGGQGCGVCFSLKQNYDITEETDREGPKDTSRLLQAGADRVYWLRVLDSHMDEGLDALYRLIDLNTPVICESNSIRQVVEPGLFLMVKTEHSTDFKPTAQAVADLADRTILSDGKSFDPDPSRISLSINGWFLRESATAMVLAGGASTRMGQDKSMLSIGGRPLIQQVVDQLSSSFEEIIISANKPATYAFLELNVVPDRQPNMGPLMGIASALTHARHELAFAVACDIPCIDINLIHRMLNLAEGYDAVLPRTPIADNNYHIEPLFAVYRKSAADRMFELLEQGERRIRSFYDAERVHFIDLEADAVLENLNTEAEFQAYASRITNLYEQA